MPLADLMQALELEAAESVRAILDDARARAAALEADAARERTERSKRATRERCDACRTDADARLASAHRDARARVLAARAEMLDRVRDAVRAQLPARASEIGDVLVTAAQACAGTTPGVRRDLPTGVIVELASGTQLVATLDALLDREWPALATAILELAKEAA